MSIRTEQVEANLQRLLGEIFNREIELPLNHLVTISRVKISSDLKESRVFISVFPFDSGEEIMAMLNKKRIMIQKELHRRLKMRYSPVLTFIFDETGQKTADLEKLIDDEAAEL